MMSAKSRKPQKVISLILAAIIFCSSVVSLFAPSTSYAEYNANSIKSQNDRTILAALEACLDVIVFSPIVGGGGVNKTNISEVVSGLGSSGITVPVGYEIDSQDGNVKCTGISLTRATRVIDKTPHWFFNKIYDLSNPVTGDNDTLAYKQRAGFLNSDLKTKLENLTPSAAKPPIKGEEKKRRVARAFWLCNEEVPDSQTPARTFNKIGGKTYQYKEGKSGGNQISVGVDLEPINGKFRCDTLLHWGDKGWLAQALRDYPSDSFSGSGAGAPPEADGGGGSDSSCQGGALGWILCPMIDLLSKTTTFAANMVDSLLQFRVLAKEAANGNETIRSAWQGVLSVANIFLVLAFLIIIFSQSTSLGLSNYGIKRMLPRLILAAILINVSFYICAFLVDISNIVGSSVLGFLTGPGTIGDAFSSGVDKSGGFAQALVGGVAIVAIIFFFLLPVLLAILLVLLLLIARLVILGVLIVVSPLAFAAWLLPNTESYFKKWWDLFTKLLFIYPVIMAVFGASLLFSKLGQDLAYNNDPTIGNLISLAILAIPLFALPKILMSTNSMMGQVGGLGQKFNKFVEGSKFGQGVKARGRAYGKFGALGAAGAAQFGAQKAGGAINRRWGQRGVARSKTGYKAHAVVLGAKKVGSAASTAAQGVKKVGDFDRGVVEAAEARKRQKETDKAKRMYELAGAGAGENEKKSIGGSALRAFGGRDFANYVASKRESAFDERVGQIQSKMKLEDQSIDKIAEAMKEALAGGDRETTRAAFNQLTAMGGGGKAAIAEVLQTTTFSPDMDATVNNAVDANYSSNVEKEGFIAKGRASGGTFSGDLSGLSPEQLAGQTKKSLDRLGHTVNRDTAKAVMASDILKAKSAGPEALDVIERIAR